MMQINRENALRLWQECYGYACIARDFHGNLMHRDAYGRPGVRVFDGERFVRAGWNIHHILPLACGGTNERHNLMCTNIDTNEMAGDKTTYWIDDCLYQVQRIPGTREYQIVKLD